MVDINAFLSAQKRILDALPRLQDESIESGDYSKIDLANETLDRLEVIGEKIKEQNPGLVPPAKGPQGPTGAPGLLGQAGPPAGPSLLQQPPTPPPAQPAGPSLLQPQPQPQAPVTINVAPQGPSLLAQQYPQGMQPPPEPAPSPSRDKFGRVTNLPIPKYAEPQAPKTPDQYRDISGNYQVPRQNQPQGSPAYTGRQGEVPSLLQPTPKIPAGVINPMGLPQEGPILPTTKPAVPELLAPRPFNYAKALRDEAQLTGRSEAEIMAPVDPLARLRELQAGIVDYYGTHGGLSSLWERSPFAGLGRIDLEDVKTGDPLNFFATLGPKMATVGDPDHPASIHAAEALAEAKKIIADMQPPMVKEAAAREAQLAKMKALPSAYTPAELAAGKPSIPALLQPPTTPPVVEEPVPALLTHGEPGVPMGETVEPNADVLKKVYNTPKAALDDAKKIVEKHAPDYLEEFNKRVLTELGEAPKPNFLTIIGTILGSLAGNPTALKIWTDKVNAYNQGKQRIGSEVYGAGKQAKMIESQEKRAAGREEAAHTRAMERDKASADRLEKTLKSQEGRAKLTNDVATQRLELDRARAKVQEEIARGNMAQKPILAEMDAVARMTSAYISPEQQIEAINRVLAKVPVGGAAPAPDFNAEAQRLYALGAELSKTKPEIVSQFKALDAQLRSAKVLPPGTQRDTTMRTILDRMRILVGG